MNEVFIWNLFAHSNVYFSGQADILEALVRWHRPGVGRLYPEVFISDAEKSGLISEIDLWVFKRCCQDLRQMQKTFIPNLKIAVNLSVLTCESIYYAQKIIDLSIKYGAPLSNFEFEVTEHTQIHDIRKVISFCLTLKNMAQELGMQAVAEGIENNEQYLYMRDAGCDQLQGFLFCRPLGLDRLTPPMLSSPYIN